MQWPEFVLGAFCMRKEWVWGFRRKRLGARVPRGYSASPGVGGGGEGQSSRARSPELPRSRSAAAWALLVPSQLKVTAKIQHFATLSAASRVVCMLKYPCPRQRHWRKWRKKAYLECPSSAVNYCLYAVDGKAELFHTALNWASAYGWQWDTGTELRLEFCKPKEGEKE